MFEMPSKTFEMSLEISFENQSSPRIKTNMCTIVWKILEAQKVLACVRCIFHSVVVYSFIKNVHAVKVEHSVV